MKIETDAEGKQILIQVCDAALKYGGVQVFNSVGLIMNAIRKIEEPEKPDGDDKKI